MSAKKNAPPFIISAELAERVSYYGFNTILFIFLTRNFLLKPENAKFWVHIFIFVSYGMTLPGAILADVGWGRYNTIIRFSVAYVIGHGILALYPTPTGFLIGCAFIAIGSGALKPNVASLLGDQLVAADERTYERTFSRFYLAINLGGTLAFISAEYLLNNFGPEIAFGIPGIVMAMALVIFWIGRKHYVVVPTTSWYTYRAELFDQNNKRHLLRLCLVYLFLSIFWALFDQSSSTLIEVAEGLQRSFTFKAIEYTILPTQFRAVNSIFVLLVVPLFSVVLYPFLRRKIGIDYRKKLLYGMVLAVLSFIVVGIAQEQIAASQSPSVAYIVVCYGILTAAEVLISVTALEMAYALANKAVKSTIGSFYTLSIAIGNLITALINLILDQPTFSISDANYIWLFMSLMFLTTVLFAFVGRKVMPQLDRVNNP